MKWSACLLTILSLFCFPACADELLVAVASNFMPPMEKLAQQFEQSTGHRVVLASGSSGKLYAQIRHGAPFQIFLSADDDKPAALIKEGLALDASRFTYAYGRLVLWSADVALVDGPEVLSREGMGRLAISNPRLAPYGAAAVEVLEHLGVWDQWSRQVVQGENITQTFNFVRSGNAALGLVAASQVVGQSGSAWKVPAHMHGPIKQEAVVLKRAGDLTLAHDFMSFLRSDAAQAIISGYGYDVQASVP